MVSPPSSHRRFAPVQVFWQSSANLQLFIGQQALVIWDPFIMLQPKRMEAAPFLLRSTISALTSVCPAGRRQCRNLALVNYLDHTLCWRDTPPRPSGRPKAAAAASGQLDIMVLQREGADALPGCLE